MIAMMSRIAKWRSETPKETMDRIRAEIKAENERNLSDPSLYLNRPKRVDGSLHEAEREQVNVTDG